MFDDIFLHGAWVVEARFDEVVQEPQQELLSVFLHPMAVGGHDLPHEGCNDLGMCPLTSVRPFQILYVSAKQAARSSFAKRSVRIVVHTYGVQRNSVGETLHD